MYYCSMLKKLILGAGLIAPFYLDSKKREECCGIVGMLSKRTTNNTNIPQKTEPTVQKILCDGIQLLKNRGYDSAGVASFTLQNGSVNHHLVRYADEKKEEMNCIEKVVEQVSKNIVNSVVGIAHTRWATCGKRVAMNAHPHFDQDNQIFLVHNGIIGNHAEIKNKYLSDIHFSSQTDTEVIAQLLAKFRKQGKTMVEALKQFEKVVTDKSQWGLVVIDKANPNAIYTATSKAPMLIGFSPEEDQIIVTSEQIAFQKYADCFFQSKEKEVCQLMIQNIPKLKQSLKAENRLKVLDTRIQVLKTPPKPFANFYTYQVSRQGQIPFVPDFQRVKVIPFGDYLSMIACGSSYFSANASQYFFKKLKCFKKVYLIDPVELHPDDITENETVVLVSQSGQTKDLLDIVQECMHKKNVKTIGIINVQGSTLARKVDFPIYIKVGREVSVAATKSFFHSTLNLIQFATEVAEQKNSAPLQLLKQIRLELLDAPSQAKKVISQCHQKCVDLANLIYKKQSIYLLGKRQSLPIAKEAALKIKQLTYIHAQAFGACQMKHGPIALINSDQHKQTVVILFVLDNQTLEVMTNALDQMHSRKAYVVVVTDCEDKLEETFLKKKEKDQTAERKYDFLLPVPRMKHISHLLSIIPIQMLVGQISRLKQINPDMPRNLAKSVTV